MKREEVEKEWLDIRAPYTIKDNGQWISVASKIHNRVAYNRKYSGPYVSNITPFVPIFILIPPNHHGQVKVSDIESPVFFRLPTRTEGIESPGSTMNSRQMWWRIRRLESGFYFVRSLSRGRISGVELSFMNCIAFPEMSDESTSFAWTAVIPMDSVLDFHSKFLNRDPIYPDEFGMEFWYCTSVITQQRMSLRLFRNYIIPQLQQLGLRGVSKTPEQMKELFTVPIVTPERFSTVIKRKIAAQEVVHKVMT